MVTKENLLKFLKSHKYIEAIKELINITHINAHTDDNQFDFLLDYHLKMIINAKLDIEKIIATLADNKEYIFLYSKRRIELNTHIDNNEDFYEGYEEYEKENEPELEEEYYPITFLLAFIIEYILLQGDKKFAILCFKKQGVSKANKFYDDLISCL